MRHPDILHVDHGSDFTSRHLEHTAIALRVRIIHSTVGRPQGHGKIERFFRTINTELLASLPGHIAPRAQPTAALTLPELDAAVASFIIGYNQIQRVLRIKRLETITDDVIEAAASVLVTG